MVKITFVVALLTILASFSLWIVCTLCIYFFTFIGAESMELENCDFLETQHDGEVLQEFEVIHTDEVIQ